ncbi:hypothetical protein [Escherichia coli]|uniref:hypothetical protein n=1 Tax=Escherichia coli TaxID=562 RepID=UPI003CCBA9BA
MREILINESAWEEMTCLFAPSLVIINKGNEEVEGTWPNKLQPGIYKNMGSNSVNIIINNTRKIIPPGKVFTLRGGTLNINIPGRSALLLGKTGEPPNYLYL